MSEIVPEILACVNVACDVTTRFWNVEIHRDDGDLYTVRSYANLDEAISEANTLGDFLGLPVQVHGREVTRG